MNILNKIENYQAYDVIIIGAGFAGTVMAERFSNDGKKVLIIERRDHIAGNMYDYLNEEGVRVQKYGPHIFHTFNQDIMDYVSSFDEWMEYDHKVLGKVQNTYVPIPFNLTSIEKCFDSEKATLIKTALFEEFKEGDSVPILKLRENKNELVQELAEFIFENVFKHYTMKQWGLEADQIDPAVTARVPVLLSYQEGYFPGQLQMMPVNGFTAVFEKMLESSLIDVVLNTDVCDHIQLKEGQIYFDSCVYSKKVIFTGQIEELLDLKYGELPYRSLEFKLEHHQGIFQEVATVNYPGAYDAYPYTRITEYKHFMKDKPNATTIAYEYPMAYLRSKEKGNIPYYPIFTKENQEKYHQYVSDLKGYSNLYLLGRLAQYQYYNMDNMILAALDLYKEIKD